MYPEPYKKKSFKNFYFVYNDPATGKRRQMSTGTDRVTAAKKFIREFMDALTRSSGMTFREYSAPYLEYDTNPRAIRYRMAGKCYGMSHCANLKSMFTRMVYPDRFSRMMMADITRGDIIDLQSRLLRDRSPATVNKCVSFVSSIFSEAFYRGDIKNNPATMLSKVRTEKRERGIFGKEEIRRMFASPDLWDSPLAYHVFMFAAYTGRRAGEILALQWEQLEDGICHIDRAWHRVERDIGTPKWNIAVEFPLPSGLVLPERTGDFVFLRNGRRIYETWWADSFRRSMEKMGIDFRGRNLTPHSFRHTLNTLLLLAGVNELFVKKYIGWRPGRDTQALYTHISTEDLMTVAETIDRIYRPDVK